jgi:beta-galactosidase
MDTQIVSACCRNMHSLSLNGPWEAGFGRIYDRTVTVPGLADDPTKSGPSPLWYRRRVDLPAEGWTHATLDLGGARFCPRVHVDGVPVSADRGGMAPTSHLLSGLLPGGSHVIEVELASLAHLPPSSASRIPPADLWRSNVSSCLWDDVRLRLHGPARFVRVLAHEDGDALVITVRCQRLAPGGPLSVRATLGGAATPSAATAPIAEGGGTLRLPLPPGTPRWSPESPACLRLRVELLVDGAVSDVDERTVGLRRFAVDGLRFICDGAPVTLRAGTVVWHRWCRDPEARELAWDAAWFEANIVRRLKAHGANTLRFHLGDPPEAFLDLCDKHGLFVQAEWHFFHGLDASRHELAEQWRAWIDRGLRHPSVVLFHPWNETDDDQLATAFAAVGELAAEYPPLVFGHRDVLHVHKYWWSLFENVGCYYDRAEDFPLPIMVDEFGGNYLDGKGDVGAYPTNAASHARFLGREHTAAQRLQHQAESHGRIAEYWRRLGAAGWSPFCHLGSPPDGNHLFLGALRDGVAKPAWDACTASWSPQAASLALWDRTFSPGAQVEAPVHWFNDTAHPADLLAMAEVLDAAGAVVASTPLSASLPAHGRLATNARFSMPATVGAWTVQVRLTTLVAGVDRPIVSAWRVRTRRATAPTGLRVCVPAGDGELLALCARHGIATVAADAADVVLFGRSGWESLDHHRPTIDAALGRGAGVAMLDIGPELLGVGYDRANDHLQASPQVKAARSQRRALVRGVTLDFHELPEPESCLFPAAGDARAFAGLQPNDLSLWNGLRGGLAAPACDMQVSGLSAAAYLSQWVARGGDAEAIAAGRQVAYVLAGQYAFAGRPDQAVADALRARVKFLVEDAPALAATTDWRARIDCVDLGAGWRAAAEAQAVRLRPLATCGRHLVRSPAVQVDMDPSRGGGRLVLSQCLTRGRLAPGFGESGFYGRRYDPAVEQFTLNLLAIAAGRT